MNGDFDGDTLRTMLTMFQGKHDSYQKFTEHQDTARALHKWDS
jgi:hypothetical protein